jgi:hypothetical protein
LDFSSKSKIWWKTFDQWMVIILRRMETTAQSPAVILDKSNVKIGPLHYLAITLWLGWICFYPLSLMLTPIFLIAFPIVVISALFTIDRKRQPRVSYEAKDDDEVNYIP